MASQGERELGVLGMDEESLESMVQDGDPEQEMLVVQDELPQLNPAPEMGAAAAAAFDTPPSPPPPKPSPDPCRNGSPECTRRGPAMRHAGSNENEYGSKHKQNGRNAG